MDSPAADTKLRSTDRFLILIKKILAKLSMINEIDELDYMKFN